MLPFRRMLFPVDFSDAAKAIVPYVLEMSRRYDAQLTLLHAFAAAPVMYGELGLPVWEAYPSFRELRGREEERLGEFARRMFPGLSPALAIEDGEAGDVIRSFVRHQGTDLVLMPTHGWGAVRRFLVGSVTAKVLHDVSCAVWTGVHHSLEEHHPRVPYRSILCAVDFGEEAPLVLQAAAALAQSYEARLSLVYSIGAPPTAWEAGFSRYRKMVTDFAEDRLRNLKLEAGVEASIHVAEGLIGEAVRTSALQAQADLIVAGRGHSQETLGRLWSQLYSIVREAPCPVLSI